MNSHVVAALLLALAGVFYVVGFATGIAAALAVAVALEIVFWIRVVRGRARPHSLPMRIR